MEIIATSAEMRAYDRYAIGKLKIPGIVLMENAGRGVVEVMIKHFGSLAGKSVIIFCGKGNNGGDGFVVSRHLLNHQATVNVVLVGKASELKGDAKVNYECLKRISKESSHRNSLILTEFKSSGTMAVLPKSDYIIDALFGTGFTGAVSGNYKKVIDWINKSDAGKISIDIPSGVNTDTGEVHVVAVKSDLTVTLALMKIGLIVGNGRAYSGTVEVADICANVGRNAISSKTYLISGRDVQSVLPRRPFNAHKHSVGKIFVLAGSRGLTGAAAMTSHSAMRAGAGAVVLGTPASVYPILAKKLTEVMVEPLEETSEGTLSIRAYGQIQKHLKWADVVIIGPGLSRNSGTRELVWKIVSESNKNLLIDADALNVLAEKPSVLKHHKSKNVIITPHTGELSRLIGVPSEEIERDRIAIARKIAKSFKLTVVLKGALTVTATETGEVYINSTGNPGMATAGSGDVLAGLIGGLWGQGMERSSAAYSGVYIHGYAGDIAKKEYGEKSLLATDIQQFLPDAITEIEGANLS